MSKIAIVTDSSAYIPEQLMKNKTIDIAPLMVLWDGESYRDGLDITPEQFYARLKVTKSMPTTSQATPSMFQEIYQRLVAEGYDIFSMHISSKLSGTLESARQAKDMFPGARIELFDSLSAGMALGFQVLAVSRLASQGATLEDCKAFAEKAKNQSGVYLVVKTLEFLHRGGRIGGASAFLGSVLDLKPILAVKDGRVEPVEKVRTMSKAIDRMLDLFEKHAGQYGKPYHLAALYTDNIDAAQLLVDRARQRFSTSEVSEAIVSSVSPAIGTHVGPGTLGLCFLAGL